MTERVKKLYEELKKREYRKARINERIDPNAMRFEDVDSSEKQTVLFCEMLEGEKIVLREGDRIGFHRHRARTPMWFPSGNITPNYHRYLAVGFGGVYREIQKKMAEADGDELEFAKNALRCIDAVFAYCDRLKEMAEPELRSVLEVVPYHAPRSYHQALVMLKCIFYTLRIAGIAHVTIGRFDKYMRPFYEADIAKGISRDELFDLTEEFFVNLNFDTDIYLGVQQGDNGQSMVLGGYETDGSDSYCELSEMCIKASLELKLIDPKINLRVGKDTPIERYRFATELTKMGMGFPQYLNDDIVIPGLMALGYAPEDAYNYGVAACWEFIVPNCSFDIPNLRSLTFPICVNNAMSASRGNESYEEFLGLVEYCIRDEIGKMLEAANMRTVNLLKHPYFSLFIDDCIDKLSDYSKGEMKYFNYGFHGVGISTAADSLAAVKKLVYDEKSITLNEVKNALSANFEGHEALRRRLSNCPKMGNNDDRADYFMCFLLDTACSYMSTLKNIHGGVIRMGTGSAQGYVGEGLRCGATADGRLANEPFACSFSPAIGAKVSGPLSVIQSFTKFDLSRAINGGPLTMEIHENTFRNEYGMMKTAQLVKSFIDMGGHQLQLNAVNREKLIEARKHPEEYSDLIVRVWGWSGYFTELDTEYQDHIISRNIF